MQRLVNQPRLEKHHHSANNASNTNQVASHITTEMISRISRRHSMESRRAQYIVVILSLRLFANAQRVVSRLGAWSVCLSVCLSQLLDSPEVFLRFSTCLERSLDPWCLFRQMTITSTRLPNIASAKVSLLQLLMNIPVCFSRGKLT
jgi:hypothetical protein